MRYNGRDTAFSGLLADLVSTDGLTGGFIKDSQAGNLPATATNDSASAGNLGEIIESTLAVGSATSLTTATTKTITSISLTAGDWDVWGNVGFIPAGSSPLTHVRSAIGPTNNTLPTNPNGGGVAAIQGTLGTDKLHILPCGRLRVSLSATTTYYLLGHAEWTVGTLTAFGYIGARRVR